ncbi:endonuclease I family protein [Bacillus benzoevorans]|uniref:Endonuclease I n=1 Tax=Bacillus benzoevorans TaxID=1456 RepID=A0A7X0HR48_9BACI|nr:endonuclease [Bacillus benzoevorans]MBB6445353.1 endonuclease I [Bacillus benzoevorans]
MDSEKTIHAIIQERINELENSFCHNIDELLTELEINKQQICTNLKLYYNERKDQKDMQHYYQSVMNLKEKQPLFFKFHDLVKRSHKERLPYFMSKDQYLYKWVDLQPDGSLKNIYSGMRQNPETLIVADFEIIQKKHAEFQKLLKRRDTKVGNKTVKIPKIDNDLKFNTEHIVPLSWYLAKEPMKGDLHHLFACQPECNIKRSNYPYADFSFYIPESPEEKIQNHCGVTMDGRFEPEYGKGTVARALMYFLLRYPGTIHKTFLRKIDRSLLLRWHQQFDINIYEKHRNQAIFLIQGNRNPFIDFPELAEELLPDYL